METPQTRLPCPPEPPPVADAPPQARGIFLRLSGHARIAVSGGVLLLKLALFGSITLVWLAMAEEVRYQRAYRSDDLILLGACMLGTVFMARLLASYAQPIIVSATAFCASALWFAAASYPIDSAMVGRAPGITHGAIQAMLALLVGAVTGHLVYSILQYLTRKLDRAPSVSGLLSTFGTTDAGEYRAELEDSLQRALTAYATLLRGGRLVVFGAIFMFLVLLSCEWTQSVFARAASPRAWSFWSEQDVAIWLAISFAAATMVGIASLPAGKGSSSVAASMGIAACMLLGVGLTMLLRNSTAIPSARPIIQVIAASAAIALPACATSQFIFGFVIRRILPAVLSRHLLPPAAEVNQHDAGHQTPLCCERCGYALDGLPASRCGMCGVDELRCPECGHQQPAGVLHARALMRVHKAHIAVRVLSWLMALGITAALLMPWFSIGAFSRGGRLMGSSVDWHELFSIWLVCALAIAPLRLLVLHWRPTVLITLLVAMAPFCAFMLGASFGANLFDQLWDMYRAFLPGWVLGSFLAPYLWRGLLILMYGRAGSATYAWHASKAYRHFSPEGIAADVDRVAGAELPLRCKACHAELLAEFFSVCAACGVRSLACPACAAPRPVSAVRIAFENMVVRARAMLLALVAAHCAAALVPSSITVLVMGFDAWTTTIYSDSPYRLLIPAVLASLIFGALIRMILIRRITFIATAAALLAHFTLFILLPHLLYGPKPQVQELVGGDYGRIYLAAAVSVIAGTVLIAPLLELLAAGVLPAANARAVMDVLRSRATLDQAASRLPACRSH